MRAVCDLFRGQEINKTEFTVTVRSATAPDPGTSTERGLSPVPAVQTDLELLGPELGTGNQLALRDEDILRNLNDVQLRNGLSPTVRVSTPSTLRWKWRRAPGRPTYTYAPYLS